MIKKWLSFAFICTLVVTTNSALIAAQTRTDDTAASVAKVKAAVLKRSKVVGKTVKLEMLNGTQLKGYIHQPGDDSFEFTDEKTNQSSSIFTEMSQR